MTNLVGITVVGGLSSENQVFARLLSERDDRYDAFVVVHEESPGSGGTADRFAEISDSSTVSLDTGWRPNQRGYRGDPKRAPVALRYRRRIDRTVAAAASFDPTLVYSSQQHYDCRAATAVARSLAVPQIVHLHYTIGPWLRRSVLNQLRSTDQVVTVSDFIRRMAIAHGVAESRVTTIHNTVPTYVPPSAETVERLRSELDITDDRYVLGLVGRLDAGKGHLDAIEAFERASRVRDDLVLVLVGSGRIEGEIRARASSSPFADRIRLTGQRSDVADLLAVFDVLLHPATEDPCPLAVLEGMAAGLPVIGYDDGGVPELVVSGATGLLVDHGDVGALTEAILALRDDPALGRRFGEAGLRRAATDFAMADAGRAFADLVTTLG